MAADRYRTVGPGSISRRGDRIERGIKQTGGSRIAGGHDDEEKSAEEGAVDDFGRGDRVHGVHRYIEAGPSAADQAAGEDAIVFAGLEDVTGSCEVVAFNSVY